MQRFRCLVSETATSRSLPSPPRFVLFDEVARRREAVDCERGATSSKCESAATISFKKREDLQPRPFSTERWLGKIWHLHTKKALENDREPRRGLALDIFAGGANPGSLN